MFIHCIRSSCFPATHMPTKAYSVQPTARGLEREPSTTDCGSGPKVCSLRARRYRVAHTRHVLWLHSAAVLLLLLLCLRLRDSLWNREDRNYCIRRAVMSSSGEVKSGRATLRGQALRGSNLQQCRALQRNTAWQGLITHGVLLTARRRLVLTARWA